MSTASPRVLFDLSGLVQWYAFLPNPSGIQRVTEQVLSQPVLQNNSAVTFIARALGSDRFYLVEREIISGLVDPVLQRASVARLRNLFAASMRLADPARLQREMRAIHLPYIGLGFTFTERFFESYCSGRWAAPAPPLKTLAADARHSHLVGLGDFWCHQGHVDALVALKRRSDARFIHLIHDLIAAANPQWAHPHYGKLLVDQLDRLAPAIDHWLVTSNYVGGQLASYLDRTGLPPRPVDTMPMGWPDRARISEGDDGTALAEYGLRRQGFFLHVGTVEPRKNLEGLFDALTQLRAEPAVNALPCLLVGRDGWRSETIRHRLRNDPWLGGRIRWIKDATDGDLAALYRNARATVVPSFDEGWGLAVQESLAHGTPCIATRVGGIPEAGRDLATYVESGDTAALAAAILRFARDDAAVAEARSRIASGLRATALPTWQTSAQWIAELLQRPPVPLLQPS
jgi:glycosyltransferase involved in cell wall biosynthesis